MAVRTHDLSVKKDEYKGIASVDTVVFVDVEKRALAVHQRIDGGWTETLFSDAIDLVIPSLGLAIPQPEIFASD